jgi:hypothetical protein
MPAPHRTSRGALRLCDASFDLSFGGSSVRPQLQLRIVSSESPFEGHRGKQAGGRTIDGVRVRLEDFRGRRNVGPDLRIGDVPSNGCLPAGVEQAVQPGSRGHGLLLRVHTGSTPWRAEGTRFLQRPAVALPPSPSPRRIRPLGRLGPATKAALYVSQSLRAFGPSAPALWRRVQLRGGWHLKRQADRVLGYSFDQPEL